MMLIEIWPNYTTHQCSYRTPDGQIIEPEKPEVEPEIPDVDIMPIDPVYDQGFCMYIDEVNGTESKEDCAALKEKYEASQQYYYIAEDCQYFNVHATFDQGIDFWWIQPDFCMQPIQTTRPVEPVDPTLPEEGAFNMEQEYCVFYQHLFGETQREMVDCDSLREKYESNQKDGYISPYCWYFNVHYSKQDGIGEHWWIDPIQCFVPYEHEESCLSITHMKDGKVKEDHF